MNKSLKILFLEEKQQWRETAQTVLNKKLGHAVTFCDDPFKVESVIHTKQEFDVVICSTREGQPEWITEYALRLNEERAQVIFMDVDSNPPGAMPYLQRGNFNEQTVREALNKVLAIRKG